MSQEKKSAESQTQPQVPKGYEQVPAGQFAPFALYRCARCGTVFVSGHYASVRFATGRIVSCCGTASCWLMNLKRKETTSQ